MEVHGSVSLALAMVVRSPFAMSEEHRSMLLLVARIVWVVLVTLLVGLESLDEGLEGAPKIRRARRLTD